MSTDATSNPTVDPTTKATEVFAAHRNLLFTVAYQMLGSTHDAEDVVQETWLRWAEVDLERINDPRAYLVKATTRQAFNRLRTLRRQREEYVGPWLPEPLLTQPDIAEDVELADSLSMAMMVVLESLTPHERAVFVLREVFGFEYGEIAQAIDRNEPAVRQLATRAKKHIQARRPRGVVPEPASEVVSRFLLATTSGDIQPLLDVLAPDVVLLTDGGGKIKAALRPITGSEKVARFLAAVAQNEFELEWTFANGAPAAVLSIDGRRDALVTMVVADGRVTEIYFLRNPDKLGGLSNLRTDAR
jgi:RNA polymerase sigma-70 factor (ECF subfamily)